MKKSKKLLKQLKKILPLMLSIVIIVGIVPIASVPVSAATTSNTVETITLSTVLNRINDLKSKLNKNFFTVSGNPCIPDKSDLANGYHGECRYNEPGNCKNENVISAEWFENLMGVENIPTSISNVPGIGVTSSAWTCAGFANYAVWYLFKTSNTDKISVNKVYTDIPVTIENISLLKPGDGVRTKRVNEEGKTVYHSFIYVSNNEYFDCNGYGAGTTKASIIQFHNGTSIVYNRFNSRTMSVFRATNSNFENSKIKGYYYIVNDSEGHNVRSSASTSASIVGVLPDGEKVLITKYSSDNNWGYVTYDGFSGWTNLSSTYMKFDSICYEECEHNYSSASYESTHPHKEYKKCSLCGDVQYTGNTKLVIGCTSCYPADGELYLCTDEEGHNIRNSASETGTTILGVIPYNKYFVVTKKSSNGTWGYVTYGNVSGWTKLYYKYTQYVSSYYCPKVYFDINDGTIPTTSTAVYIGANYGELPTPTRTGYTFNGWYTEDGGGTRITENTIVEIERDQTLYANWKSNSYTVSFNATGGSVSTKSKTVYYGQQYGALPEPTRDGYHFKGWYDTNGTKITATHYYRTASNTTLTARWEVYKYYTILYQAGSTATNVPESVTKTHDIDVTLSTKIPQLKGCTFVTWTDGTNNYSPGSVYSKNAPLTVNAVWKANTYTIYFNPNGGNVSISCTKVTYTSKYGSLPTPTRIGYTFDGWYTAETGGRKIVEDTIVTTAENHTLYAHWVENTSAPCEFMGSQIRTTGDQGLRFVFSIPKEQYELVSDFGTVVMPKKYLGDNLLTQSFKTTANGKEYKAKTVPAVKIFDETETDIYYTVCITHIPLKKYTNEYVAVPYITYMDGKVEKTIYGDMSSMTVYDIAQEAYADSRTDTATKEYLYKNILSAVDPQRYPVK